MSSGVGREAFWDAVNNGRSVTRAIVHFDASSLPCRIAAALELAPLEARGDERRYAKVSRMAMLAAREVLADAGLGQGLPNAGVLIGIDVAERHYADYCSGHPHRVSP